MGFQHFFVAARVLDTADLSEAELRQRQQLGPLAVGGPFNVLQAAQNRKRQETHPALGAGGGLERTHRPCGQVPAVFVRVPAAVEQLALQFGKVFFMDEAFTHHHKPPLVRDGLRDAADRPGIVGDVFANFPVPAGRGPQKGAVLINQFGSQAVQLIRQVHPMGTLEGQQILHLLGFLQRQQRDLMLHLFQSGYSGVANGLGRGVRHTDAGFLFQPDQLIKQPVVDLIGDRWDGFVVILVPIFVQLSRQLFDAGNGFCCTQNISPLK